MATGLTTTGEQSLSVRNATELIPAIKEYGAMIAKGGLFGCKNPEAGQTLVLMAMSEGIPITEMRRRYHIIGGSDLSMRADYMLAEFRRIGGWYQWIDQGDDGKTATLHIKYRENDLKVSYTIEMAKKAGLIKPKSGWEKNPGEMLRARCQTKAVRMVCPEVLAGFATDEELGADPDSDAIDSEVIDRATPPAATATQVAATPVDAQADDGEIADAQFEVKADFVAGLATGEQIKVMTALFTELEISADKQLGAFKSMGADDLGDLTEEGASVIIGQLLQKKAGEIAAKQTEPEATATPAARATDKQCEELQTLIRQVAQAEGGVDVVTKVKAHMQKHGLDKFADLSTSDAQSLIGSLQSNNGAKTFLTTSLEGAAKKD
ncbi:hypothetical protein Pla52o_35420 [Novipirellula galeiformis]|uniref:RecT family protein n=1 Tax=Novipirellula galeiformis TaxID=2528004 RepID=A0A5C6CEP1_9BACT|nr:hypothetical protein [Novipirellula galeiformis]TWU22485.1 hypothetical protein Pla52o_35420 [Novipirellula galeiformis]